MLLRYIGILVLFGGLAVDVVAHAAPAKKPPARREGCDCGPTALQLKFRKLSTDKLILQAQSKKSKVRMEALQAMQYQGEKAKKAIPLLLKFARTRKGGVRLQALLTLSHVGRSNPKVHAFFRPLFKDKSSHIRLMVTHAVAHFGPKRILKFLPLYINAMLHDSDLGVRRSALLSLQMVDWTSAKPRHKKKDSSCTLEAEERQRQGNAQDYCDLA